MKELATFIKNSLSSKSAESFSRTACAIVLYFLLCWASYIVSKTGAIPDIPPKWSLLIGVLYGIGKTGETIQAVKGAQDAP